MNLLAAVSATTHVITHVITLRLIGITLFVMPQPSVISTVAIRQQSSPAPVPFVAIMPNIPSHIMLGENPTLKVSTAAHASGSSPLNGDIEPHQAFLIFKDQDLQDVKGWEVMRLEDGYLAIPLHGEHLTLAGNSSNPPVTGNVNLGHITDPANPIPLRPEYRPPAYSDAAAVFEMPTGTLRTCAKTPGDPNTRIDVELDLTNDGSFTFRSGDKTLTVRGDAIVVAANAPFAYLKDPKTYHNEMVAHNEAYCRMLTSGQCWAGVHSLTRINLSSTGDGSGCKDQSGFRTNSNQSSRLPAVPPQINEIMNSECSNSRWP